MLRQQSVFGTLRLGFQQYLYTHLYFTFRFVSMGSNFYVLPTHTHMVPLFQSSLLVMLCFVCTIYIIVQLSMSYLEVHLLYMDK